MKHLRKNQVHPGDLVRHQKSRKKGLLVQKTIHDGYYRVISDGKITEWHISNIYVMLNSLGEKDVI